MSRCLSIVLATQLLSEWHQETPQGVFLYLKPPHQTIKRNRGYEHAINSHHPSHTHGSVNTNKISPNTTESTRWHPHLQPTTTPNTNQASGFNLGSSRTETRAGHQPPRPLDYRP